MTEPRTPTSGAAVFSSRLISPRPVSSRLFSSRLVSSRLFSSRESRRFIVIAVAGVAYFVGLAVALRIEWYPQALPGYIFLGVVGVIGAATSQRWPTETLTLVTAFTAYTTLAPLPTELYGIYLGAPQALVPLAIVTFIIISDDGPAVASAATLGTLSALVILPWQDIVRLADGSGSLSDVLMFATSPNRSMLAAELAACALVIVFAVMLRRQRRATDELSRKNQELTELRAAEVARIAEQERARIARDMHDEVAHHVAALVIRAQAAITTAHRQPDELVRAVQDIAQGGQDVLARIRTVVRVLKSAPARIVPEPLCLAAELEVLFDGVRSIGYAVDATIQVDDDVSAAHQLAIVGIVQECITNTMLHSSAQALHVVVEQRPASWTLTVADPGPARERFPDMPQGGTGLPTMQDRLAALGGRLTAGSDSDGRGWIVTAEIPQLEPVRRRTRAS